MNPTKIEWTEKVWNPSIGCDKVSLTDNQSKDASATIDQRTSNIPAGESRSKDASGTLELERGIDELVYKLYDLTVEEEVRIIEEKP